MFSLSTAFKSSLMCQFLINSWVAAAVIPLVLRLSLSLILGWRCLWFSWSAKKYAWVVIWTRWVSLESSAILIFLFIVIWLGLERNWLSLFWDPKPLPFTTSGSPIVCAHLLPHVLPHLPPHFFSCYLRNSTLCSWWFGCNLLIIIVSVYFVECCLTWSGEKRMTPWFEVIDLH